MSVNRSNPEKKPRGMRSASARGQAGRTSTARRASAKQSAPTGQAAQGAKHASGPGLPSRPTGRSGSDVEAIAKDLSSDLDAMRDKVQEMTARIAERRTDEFGAVGEIFADELRALLGDALPDPGAVRRAARLAVADQAWSKRIGTLLESRDVVELLGVSKQRVSTLAREHRLIAVPQAGRTRFPAWQFALPDPKDRECLAQAHQQLVEVGALAPWTAASWFQQEHTELDALDPVTFLRDSGDRARLLTVVSRDAERLAQ